MSELTTTVTTTAATAEKAVLQIILPKTSTIERFYKCTDAESRQNFLRIGILRKMRNFYAICTYPSTGKHALANFSTKHSPVANNTPVMCAGCARLLTREDSPVMLTREHAQPNKRRVKFGVFVHSKNADCRTKGDICLQVLHVSFDPKMAQKVLEIAQKT